MYRTKDIIHTLESTPCGVLFPFGDVELKITCTPPFPNTDLITPEAQLAQIARKLTQLIPFIQDFSLQFPSYKQESHLTLKHVLSMPLSPAELKTNVER